MKDFIFVFILFSNLSYSQIIPSFQGVHSHNTTSESMSTYALDFANNDFQKRHSRGFSLQNKE